ncbi:MAG: chromosomal replication initiator protein DnaA [Campylobacterota bacterium]|nr:chromosomal replication initiator protein DnaA [Campylobacterota bacterium]
MNVLLLLRDEINESEYNRYIKQLKFHKDLSNDNKAVYIAPNLIVAKWIQRVYSDKIAHLHEVKDGKRPEVVIEVESNIKSQKINKKSRKKEDVSKKAKNSLLNQAYTFENFVVGGSNQFAYSAAKSVSEKPGISYNPFFIYGNSGIGKTHLIHAIGNVIQSQGKTVIYVTSEQFTNDFTSNLHNMHKFKEKYRKCDCLLIDDIQFLSNKDATQEEFFHTFEALKNDNKQIILTADKQPKKIGGFEERLRTRFEWGLVADIQPPELETKIAIIKKKCEINRVNLNSEVINYVATIIENNTREIEGILSKLHAYSQLMHIDITIEFAKNVLKEQIAEKRANITVDLIMSTVSHDLNVKPSEIKSKGRSRNIVYARRIAIYLIRSLTPNTMPEIAKYFSMKDHTAVSHTIKKINELLEEDEDFKVKIESLTNKITTNKN